MSMSHIAALDDMFLSHEDDGHSSLFKNDSEVFALHCTFLKKL